jgi:preprotein translocase subunit SecA
MFGSIAKKIFGSKNSREIKRMAKVVKRIGTLEEEIAKLDDSALQAKTDEFKARIAKGETLDQILPDAFAGRS